MADSHDMYDLADAEPEPAKPADESDEPVAKPRAAPAPLPRLWKAEPEPEPEPEPESAKSRKKAAAEAASKPKPAPKKAPPVGEDGERKGVLIEETPEFDTIETRQRARIIIGVVLVGFILLSGMILYRTLAPRPVEETEAPFQPPPPAPGPAQVAESKEQTETEARALYDRAHEVARTGDAELVVSILAKVIKVYPETAAGAAAREALDRPNRNLPLFPDRPAVLAHRVAPPAPVHVERPPPAAVVEAAPVAPRAGGSGEASLTLPANAAEPPRNVQDPAAPASNAPGLAARPLPAGFRIRPGSRLNPAGWPLEIVGDRDGAPMLLVPGGTFLMGRDDGEPNEKPAHRVTLSTYYIDMHEVTVRQFDLFQKEAGIRADRERAVSRDANAAAMSDDAPVILVNARDAKEYADWSGKRLPTEAQWEMAARGTDGRIHPWGSLPPNWEKKREPRQIDPVMSFASDVSPFGVHDMAGNAWEWTKDWYDPRYFQSSRSQAASDPAGPSARPKSLQLVVKGGSKTWTVTCRDGLKFDIRLPYLGFRCALPVEGPDLAPTPAAPGPAGPGQHAPQNVITF